MNDSFKNSDKILVIDDDTKVLETLVRLLKKNDFKCLTATSAAEGIEIIERDRPLVVLTDLRMDSENDGISVLEESKRLDPDSVVLLYTAYGTVPNAVEAFKKGAFDFIQKVQTTQDILLPIQRAIKFATVQRENVDLKNRLNASEDGEFYGAVSTSPVMRKIFEIAKRVARTDTTVLITGESGTGKEVMAQGIHYHSPRRENPFIPVAVGTLPGNLLEAELFGHVKGAFTGATGEKAGLFEAADSGTIFLDEIGEVGVDTQHKLLRVLQERTVRRIGSLKEQSIDVRVLSATNQDPEKLIKEGKMREDLYWRLKVIQIEIPPLRDRREEIPALAYHFLKKYASTATIEIKEIAPDTLMALQDYEWPGNIRELQGVIQHMLVMSNHPVLRYSDLPEYIRPSRRRVVMDTDSDLNFKEAKSKIIEDFEKNYISSLLTKHNGNITKVADEAGLNRKTIYRLMESRNIFYDRKADG
ncbi:response regulator [candidate division KSB1 bacterium]|nr:response regulator [candidate division KSB1 bacterium]